METTKTITRKRWSDEEMMCLYTLVQERNGRGLEEFLKDHPHRTRNAARKRYNLIAAGKINVAVPNHTDGVILGQDCCEPFRPNMLVRLWRFIKGMFRHDE